jgi:signal transduction histidine kinase
VTQITRTLWKTTATAAAMSVILLILALTYFLRRTIANDRKLRRAEDQNTQLMVKLHEAQRQLMNSEKLAAMGQLTASFAHEIGTPLNAIGGHLQLLREEIQAVPGGATRMEIIEGQVGKIEQIVQDFLQSTAKPTSQRQLVDLNRLLEQTLGIVRPRLESIGVEVRRELGSDVAPLRAVPLDFEQVLLNLVTNSLDSLKAKKAEHGAKGVYRLELATELERTEGKDWARISVYDSGQGIPKSQLGQVTKPFFTTKGPGEGTGLGLAICQDLVRKYGGAMEIESRKGAWTQVTLRIPYQYS